ncbi:MAG: hypothetical protein U0X87_11895 [Anaerolineales bacterium]
MKIIIARKECWASQALQERDYLAIFHAAMPSIDTDLFNRNTPTFKKALAFGDIFVQNIHAARLKRKFICVLDKSRLAS